MGSSAVGNGKATEEGCDSFGAKFSIPDTDWVSASTILMPLRECMLTLASEGLLEQSCVTNSSYLSLIPANALDGSALLVNTNQLSIVVSIILIQCLGLMAWRHILAL